MSGPTDVTTDQTSVTTDELTERRKRTKHVHSEHHTLTGGVQNSWHVSSEKFLDIFQGILYCPSLHSLLIVIIDKIFFYCNWDNRTSLQACVRLVYHVWIKLSLSAMFLVWLANSNYVIWVAIIVFRYTDLDLARIWDTPAHRFIFQCRQLFSVAAELNKGCSNIYQQGEIIHISSTCSWFLMRKNTIGA